MGLHEFCLITKPTDIANALPAPQVYLSNSQIFFLELLSQSFSDQKINFLLVQINLTSSVELNTLLFKIIFAQIHPLYACGPYFDCLFWKQQ